MLEKIYSSVLNCPNKIAYVINNESITYKQLWDTSLKYSDYLKRQGTSPVIIYGNKEIDMIISILSCIMAKRTYIPVGLFTPLFRIKKIMRNTNCSLILSDYELNIPVIEVSNLDNLSI